MDWIVSKTVQLTAKIGYVTMSMVLAFARMERTDLLFAVKVSYILFKYSFNLINQDSWD